VIESKIELTDRLRREGRWGEASRFKEQALKECRAKGLTGQEAKEAAWEATARAYPPVAVTEETADPVEGQKEASTPVSPSPQGVKIPPDWPLLPGNATPKAEVEWVAANLTLCRGRRTSGPDTMDLSRAASPAPSLAAIGMLEAAISNPNKFMLEVYPRFVTGDETGGEQDEKIREEKLKIEDIKECLGKLQEGAHENFLAELRAGVPATIHNHVRRLLVGFAIPDDAKTDLEAHVGRLVQDCVQAIGHTSEGG
jgi:hypothetical protein